MPADFLKESFTDLDIRDSPFLERKQRFAPFLVQGNGYLLSFSKNECFLPGYQTAKHTGTARL